MLAACSAPSARGNTAPGETCEPLGATLKTAPCSGRGGGSGKGDIAPCAAGLHTTSWRTKDAPAHAMRRTLPATWHLRRAWALTVAMTHKVETSDAVLIWA